MHVRFYNTLLTNDTAQHQYRVGLHKSDLQGTYNILQSTLDFTTAANTTGKAYIYRHKYFTINLFEVTFDLYIEGTEEKLRVAWMLSNLSTLSGLNVNYYNCP